MEKPLTEVEAKELCEGLLHFSAQTMYHGNHFDASTQLMNVFGKLGMHMNFDRLSHTLRLATSFHDVVVVYDRELQKAREERDALRVEVSSLKTSLTLSRSVIGVKHTYCKNCGDEDILDINQDTGLCRMCWNTRGDE